MNKQPYVDIFVNNKNVNQKISSSLLAWSLSTEIMYNEFAQYDDVSFTLAVFNGKDLQYKYPKNGDELKFVIHDVYGKTREIKGFYVDCVNLNVSNGQKTITVLASTYNRKNDLSATKTQGYHGLTFSQIVKKIASQANNPLTTKFDADFVDFELPANVTQFNQSDMSFLVDLAMQYGYVVSIRNGDLCIAKYENLEGKSSVRKVIDFNNIEKSQILDYSLVNDASFEHKSIKAIQQNYNKATSLINTNVVFDNTYGDKTLVVSNYTTNQGKSETLYKNAMLNLGVRKIQRGALSSPVSAVIIAGDLIEFKNHGVLDGKYLIHSSTINYTNDACTMQLTFFKTISSYKNTA